MVETLREQRKTQTLLKNSSKSDYKTRSVLQKKLDQARSYNKILSSDAKDLLTNICLNLNTPKNYCYQYFSKSFWSSQYKNRKNNNLFRSFCKGIKKSKCINTLNSKPEFCHFAGMDYPALFPKPSCLNISKALLKSNTNHFENDCPQKVGNEAVTSFSRVINGKKNLGKSSFTCEANSTYPFAKKMGELNDYNSWTVNLCYLNKLNSNKKECYPTLYSDTKTKELSLPSVVGKILERTRGYKEGNCKLVQEQDYKPTLLEFRSGCHIILKKEQCFGVDCPFKVILDQTEIDYLIPENKLNFPLFPYDFINENKSIIRNYAKEEKLTLKSVKNMSSYLFIKSNHPKAQFIGIGCREDLLPSFFQRHFLNSCTPLTFEADGFFLSKGSYSLVVRAGMDQVHAPRIIPWSYIFNSVKNFQQLHPIKIWGFYGIY